MTLADLSIAIPAYKRRDLSILNHDYVLAEAQACGVRIFISDDSPDGDLEALAAATAPRFDGLIHYRRNTPGLGHDANVMSSLLWPDTSYVWIMGDALRPAPGMLRAVVESLHGQDLQLVNWSGVAYDTAITARGDEARELLRSRLWHQTFTGATIYHRRVRTWAAQSLERPVHANFPHLDVMLGYAGQAAGPCITWFPHRALIAGPKTPSYWADHALDVFVEDWADVIRAHPIVIPAEHVGEVIRSHSLNTGLFSKRQLVRMRATGHLRWRWLLRRDFWWAMHLHPAFTLAAAMLPPPVARAVLAAWARHAARPDPGEAV